MACGYLDIWVCVCHPGSTSSSELTKLLVQFFSLRRGTGVPDGVKIFLSSGGVSNKNQEGISLICRKFRPIWPGYDGFIEWQIWQCDFGVVWWVVGHGL